MCKTISDLVSFIYNRISFRLSVLSYRPWGIENGRLGLKTKENTLLADYILFALNCQTYAI